jgi:hypothetical protein
LIGTMIYTFSRMGTSPREGKEHEAPCHHKLEQYLDEYIAATGIAGEKEGPVRTLSIST